MREKRFFAAVVVCVSVHFSMTLIHQSAFNVTKFPYDIKLSWNRNVTAGQISRLYHITPWRVNFFSPSHGERERAGKMRKPQTPKIWLSIVTLTIFYDWKMKSSTDKKTAFQWRLFFMAELSNAMYVCECVWLWLFFFCWFLWCLFRSQFAFIAHHPIKLLRIPYVFWLRSKTAPSCSRSSSCCCSIHYFGNCLISAHIRPQMKPTQPRNEIKIQWKYLLHRFYFIFLRLYLSRSSPIWFVLSVAPTPDNCSGSYLLLIEFTLQFCIKNGNELFVNRSFEACIRLNWSNFLLD